MKFNNKGFTLIELLVVIAIIGILSSVVLASLNKARDKGADAAVKADLKGVTSQAAIFEDDNGSYTGICLDDKVIAAVEAAGQAGSGDPLLGECEESAAQWAVAAPLKVLDQYDPLAPSGQDYWCVDYTGASKVIDDSLAGATVCP